MKTKLLFSAFLLLPSLLSAGYCGFSAQTHTSTEGPNGNLIYGSSLCQNPAIACTSLQSFLTYTTGWNGTYCYRSARIIYTKASSCPTGTVVDANGICIPSSCTLPSTFNYKTQTCSAPPPPTTCDWATTPPYTAVSRTELTCNNSGNTSMTNDMSHISYYFNYSWCSADSSCYAREYYCPVGQQYDMANSKCSIPTKAPTSSCPEGFFKQSGSITGPSGPSCFTDFICRSNPTIRTRTEVSCGAGPVDSSPEINPDAPSIDDGSTPPAQAYSDGVAECKAHGNMARIMCIAPKILSFSCDPTTGQVTRSECKDPSVPTTNAPLDGDELKSATTKDIKDLGNMLPTSIKDALKDYFTDGSMPHLEAIRGTLEASTILQSDANQKLDSLSASADAGLALQSDTISKIGESNTKLDTLNETMKEGKTNQIFPGFEDSPLIEKPDNNSSVFNDISGFVGQIASDATGISSQFETAKKSLDTGFQPVVCPTGQCQDIQFSIPGSGVSQNIPMSQIPSIIAPYAPIISLLVYIVLMFGIFRFLFLFFISRSR